MGGVIIREEALCEIDFYREKGTDYLKVKYVSMYSLINKIYDDHESEIKAKDEEIAKLEQQKRSGGFGSTVM